jgi:hypothetical protein
MKLLTALASLIFGWTLTASATESMTPAPSDIQTIKAKELVHQLADPRYRVRAAAAQELLRMGRAAKPALVEGLKSPDAEVWNRCSLLLPEVMAADLRARVDAFIADAEGKQTHDLPMMKAYQKIAGNELPARKFFGEIVKKHGSFLEACELAPGLAGEKYAAMALERQMQGRRGRMVVPVRVDPIDLAALFLVGADPEMSKGIVNVNNVNPVSNLLWQQEFQNGLVDSAQGGPLRKLFFAWAEQRDDVNSISMTLSVVQNLTATRTTKEAADLKADGLGYAVKVMKMKDLQIWLRAQAVVAVGRMGGKDQAPAFEALFKDTTQLTVIPFNQVMIKTQLNDVALAMAVHVSGQNPKDYGFDALQGNANANMIWSYHFLGFSTDEKRTAAFKKFADWSEAQKKKKD